MFQPSVIKLTVFLLIQKEGKSGHNNPIKMYKEGMQV